MSKKRKAEIQKTKTIKRLLHEGFSIADIVSQYGDIPTLVMFDYFSEIESIQTMQAREREIAEFYA